MIERDSLQKPFCYCGEKVPNNLKDEIRNQVCQDLRPYKIHNGKPYCVLHYPDLDKVNEFSKVFQERCEKKLSNFRAVWFPVEVNFSDKNLEFVDFCFAVFKKKTSFNSAAFYDAKFWSATFLDEAQFNLATFKTNANFISTVFSADAQFIGAKFCIDSKETTEAGFMSGYGAQFSRTTFSANANFENAKFWGSANFNSTNFLAKTNFTQTVFFQYANFSSAFFEEKSQTKFEKTIFKKYISFHSASLIGYLYFVGGIWSEKIDGSDKVLTKVFEGENNFPIFHDAHFEKLERIYFHSVRLRPFWFVNADSRKVTFINIDWQTGEGISGDIEFELEFLKKSYTQNPHRLLTIVFRQLSGNAEENNRLEEASNFRRMALETERLERKEKRKIWLVS
jgi:uncharacterized protein YjbI with pentapeptide repeats